MGYRKLQYCINIAVELVSGKTVNNIDSILDIFGCVVTLVSVYPPYTITIIDNGKCYS